MAEQQNQAAGSGEQQPNEQTNSNTSDQSGEDIVQGARNEDQLDSFKGNATQTTQGDNAEKEENLGGTTNMSLDQLKTDGTTGDFYADEGNEDGISDSTGSSASDDVNEPDREEDLPPAGATDSMDNGETGPTPAARSEQ